MAQEEQPAVLNIVDIPSTNSIDSIYPFLDVNNTPGGHSFLIDNTTSNERIRRQHVAGSYDEYMPNGGRKVEIMGDDYEVIIQDKTLFVQGSLNIVVLHGDCNITANNNLNLSCHKDLNMQVKGNRYTRIGGNDILEVTGDIAIRAGESDETRGTSGAGNINILAYNYLEDIKGTFTSKVNKKASVTWNWTGDQQDEEEPSPLDGTNTFWVGKNLFTEVKGKNTLQTNEVDIRAAGLVAEGEEVEVSEPCLAKQAINMSSGTGFTISAGIGEALTIQSGDLNLCLGSISTDLGDITAGKLGIGGNISTTLGNITTELGDIEATIYDWKASTDFA